MVMAMIFLCVSANHSKCYYDVVFLQLPWGRSCVDYYRNVFRQCVFSHDELLCMMTLTPSKLDIQLAKLLVEDLKILFARENKLRKAISDEVSISMVGFLYKHVPKISCRCVSSLRVQFVSYYLLFNVTVVNDVYCLYITHSSSFNHL